MWHIVGMQEVGALFASRFVTFKKKRFWRLSERLTCHALADSTFYWSIDDILEVTQVVTLAGLSRELNEKSAQSPAHCCP